MTILVSETKSIVFCRNVKNLQKRSNFLYNHLNLKFTNFETKIYQFAENLSKDYQGGYWDFYTLTNGGFFMAPIENIEKKKFFVNSPNGYSTELSSEAFGIVCSMCALNNLIFQYSDDNLLNKFYLLENFILYHQERAEIRNLLD